MRGSRKHRHPSYRGLFSFATPTPWKFQFTCSAILFSFSSHPPPPWNLISTDTLWGRYELQNSRITVQRTTSTGTTQAFITNQRSFVNKEVWLCGFPSQWNSILKPKFHQLIFWSVRIWFFIWVHVSFS